MEDPKKLSFLWPGGKERAVTFSYDDGRDHDRRLVDIFNRHGLKATFNLNSARIGLEQHVRVDEVAKLYEGHEVAVHTVTHPFPSTLPSERIIWEFLEDRRRLEAVTKQIVRGMAYPFGDYSSRVLALLPGVGIDYGRTTKSHGGFRLPDNWLEWHPTCHDSEATPALVEKFLTARHPVANSLLYVWGHSYEFEDQGRWESFEAFCAGLAAHSGNFWFATNMEIFRYRWAVDELVYGADGCRVWNPTVHEVWFRSGDEVVCLKSGASKELV